MKNLMFKMSMLLTTGDNAAQAGKDALEGAYKVFYQAMMYILPFVLAVILLLGIFFGIKLGIAFARSEDADAREKAKGQLINMLIGVGVAAVIVAVCIILVNSGVFRNLFPTV